MSHRKMLREIQHRAGRLSISVTEVRQPGHVILNASYKDRSVQISMSSSPRDEETTVRNVLADLKRRLNV